MKAQKAVHRLLIKQLKPVYTNGLSGTGLLYRGVR